MKENYTIRMEFIQYKLTVYNTNKKIIQYEWKLQIIDYKLNCKSRIDKFYNTIKTSYNTKEKRLNTAWGSKGAV